jgi:hypothetical protein
MERLFCPFCLQRLRPQDIEFRCTGRPCGRSNSCPSRLDRRLLQLWQPERLPPTFEAKRSRKQPRCPACGCPSGVRVCPDCHSQLPRDFGRVPIRSIAVVGGRSAGKSVYITVLLHELHHGLGARLAADVTSADDRTVSRFGIGYEQRMYEDHRLLRPTRWLSAGWNHIQPLAFELAVGKGRPRGTRGRELLLLYDISGAELEASAEERSFLGERMLAGCLASAGGILLLLDPWQLPGARHLATTGASRPDGDVEATSAAEVMGRVTEILAATVSPARPSPFAKPVAVVLSKLDAVAHALPEDSPLWRPPTAAPEPDHTDGDEVDAEIRRLLHDWGGPEVVRLIDDRYSGARCFPVSALGADPSPGNRVPVKGIHPSRVEEPFLWLLDEVGALPRRLRRRRQRASPRRQGARS